MLFLERISDSVFLRSLVLLLCIKDKEPCKKKSGELLQVVYFVRTFMFCGLSLCKNYMCCIRQGGATLRFQKINKNPLGNLS